MLSFAKKYAGNTHSQNGEDQIIAECIKRIGIAADAGVCVEFGAADGYYCSNTRALIDQGWDYRMFEPGSKTPGIIDAFIAPENVNELIGDCDVLSVDVDGTDWQIWEAYKGTPAIVIIEINSSIKPPERHVSKERGASYWSMLELGLNKGYFLLCHTGNFILILNDYRSLFPEVVGDGLTNWQEYFKTDWL